METNLRVGSSPTLGTPGGIENWYIGLFERQMSLWVRVPLPLQITSRESKVATSSW